MSTTELFINKSLLPFLVWLTLSMFLLGIILTVLDKLRMERKRVVVVLAPVPLTEEQETDLYAALQALDRVIATLEQDETYQREAALGNDVVRLDECRAVTEGERVLEQYQADLKARDEVDE